MRFLLVDKVLDWQPDDYLIAVKNVSLESLYFQHHFPSNPVFPGVLITEAIAQAGGYFISRSIEVLEERKYVFAIMTASKMRFLKTVFPGDQLRLEISFVSRRQSTAHIKAVASVEGKTVARGEIRFGLMQEKTTKEEHGALEQHLMLKNVLERGIDQ